MSTAIIREARLSDLPYIYEICLKTGDNGKDATVLFSDPYILGQYYSANYLFFEKELCLVAELQDDGLHSSIPQGYCLGASDTVVYSAWMNNFWLPQLRKQFPKNFKAKTTDEQTLLEHIYSRYEQGLQDWAKDFPSHLHIDLLETVRGTGCGRKIIETMFEKMAKKGSPGVHLGVGSQNENAIGFYKKMGFFVLEEKEWGLLLGHSLE